MEIAIRSSFARQNLATGITVLALTVTGRVESRLDIASFCTGWPLCAPLDWLQLLHRLLAGVAGLQILLVLGKAWHEQRHHTLILPLTTISAPLFFGQIFVGALEATNPAEHLRVLHAVASISLGIALLALIFTSALPSNQEKNKPVAYSPRQLKDFIMLTKPWIVALLLVTTFAGLVTGYQGIPPVSLIWLDAAWGCVGSRRIFSAEPIHRSRSG